MRKTALWLSQLLLCHSSVSHGDRAALPSMTTLAHGVIGPQVTHVPVSSWLDKKLKSKN